MVTTRGQGYDGAWLRPMDFMSRHKFVVSRHDFTELCHDKVFYVAIEKFMSRQRVAKTKRIGVATGFFLVAIETSQGRRFYVATGHSLSP